MEDPKHEQLSRAHKKIGWSLLFVFLVIGGVLEFLHGFKIGWYLDVDNEIRRTMLTLSHSHGTLLALVHLAFAWTVRDQGDFRGAVVASRMLSLGSLLLPLGFLIGGLQIHEGDPSLGILLVPAGFVVLVAAVALTLRAVLQNR